MPGFAGRMALGSKPFFDSPPTFSASRRRASGGFWTTNRHTVRLRDANQAELLPAVSHINLQQVLKTTSDLEGGNKELAAHIASLGGAKSVDSGASAKACELARHLERQQTAPPGRTQP